MLTGFYVLKGGGTKYTPAFGRGGGAALFAVSTLGLVGGPSAVSFTVEHKNVEDTSWTSAGTVSDITGATLWTLDVTGLMEQIRYAFAVTANNDWEGVYVLVAPPAWRPY